MAMAGADVVIAKYRYNAKTKEKSAFQSLKKMVEAAVKARRDTIVMIQTCPSSSTEQVQQALITTGAQGFIGATGIEKTLAQATLHTVFSEMLRLKR
jgi:predicted TIM-barrel enzyme